MHFSRRLLAQACQAVFLSSAALAGSALAFQPLVTDDTGTQGADGNQLELAATRIKTDTDRAGELGFAYTRGLTDALDVFIELGRQRVETAGSTTRGPTNPAIGAKWRFFENERKTSLALKPIYIAPLSAEDETAGFGTGKASYEMSFILTQEMDWGAVHANLTGGRNKYRDPANDEKNGGFSVAPVWNLTEQWKLGVDLGATRSETGGTVTKTRFGELGVIFSPNADLDFAFGLIRETDQNTDEVTKTAAAGVTWRFK